MKGTRFIIFSLMFVLLVSAEPHNSFADDEIRTYQNTLNRLHQPAPLLADYPEFIQPIEEVRRFEAPILVNDDDADLSIRSWRYSYNARGIIEIPNKIRADKTAVIMVHPWGIDDGQGWKTPEPAGVADFCTPEKNHLAGRHTREVINPFLKRMRNNVAFVMYSLIGEVDPVRKKLYRSFDYNPTKAEREQARKDLKIQLMSLSYAGESLPVQFTLSKELPVIDYFKQFSGLSAGDRFNGKGFWNVPVPVTSDITVHDEDVLIFDREGYEPLKLFLKKQGIRHILLTGYATDMCFCKTTAGYENLARDFNVFLVGDATLATFPANSSPKYATNAHISFASLNHLITQVSWIKPLSSD
ncbi:isochorismatase family protein [uncultured Gimesia sp.]|jgi:hypothetical protein|uniref:cysteine hydrolase family protein n=1 Tax=uncultured Gimesia sp. TaxID=1678688 RepID=UPI0026366E44|nr:isochorismatase family protein [uncultured Gimesia sp.]